MDFEEFKKYHNANYHDGDSTFDELNYSRSNGDDFDNEFVQDCFDHFKAGQQSKQAEIEHRTQVSAELAGELIRKRAEIDALKEKLKELEDHIFINYDYDRDDDQHSYWSGYNVAMAEIATIIKGNNNDT